MEVGIVVAVVVGVWNAVMLLSVYNILNKFRASYEADLNRLEDRLKVELREDRDSILYNTNGNCANLLQQAAKQLEAIEKSRKDTSNQLSRETRALLLAIVEAKEELKLKVVEEVKSGLEESHFQGAKVALTTAVPEGDYPRCEVCNLKVASYVVRERDNKVVCRNCITR
jgi:hypothetical protein